MAAELIGNSLPKVPGLVLCSSPGGPRETPTSVDTPPKAPLAGGLPVLESCLVHPGDPVDPVSATRYRCHLAGPGWGGSIKKRQREGRESISELSSTNLKTTDDPNPTQLMVPTALAHQRQRPRPVLSLGTRVRLRLRLCLARRPSVLVSRELAASHLAEHRPPPPSPPLLLALRCRFVQFAPPQSCPSQDWRVSDFLSSTSSSRGRRYPRQRLSKYRIPTPSSSSSCSSSSDPTNRPDNITDPVLN